MAKLINYDVTGVEESQGGTGVKVPPGVKVARIEQCFAREKKTDGTPANDLQVALNVGEEYDWVFTYIGLGPASDWKLAEFVRALGLKDKGRFDPDKAKGKIIRVKINHDTYENEYSPRAGKLFKAQPGDEVGSASVISSNGDMPDDDQPEAEADDPTEANDGFEPSRESDPEIGSYDDWSDEDLLLEVEDRGLTLPGGRGAKRGKAITALRDDDASGDAAVDESQAEDTPDDYDTWDLDALKKEWEDRNMGDLPAVRGRGAAERIAATIIEELRKDDAENPFQG